MTSSQDDSSHLTLDHNFEEARHNLFQSLCLEIRSAFINNNRQPALQLNLSSAFASCSNETEDSTDLLMIEPLQTLYRINQCNPGNAIGTAASFNLQSGSQESSIIDSLWDLSPSSDNDEIASVWHVSVKGSETHDCDNQDVCVQEQNIGVEVMAPMAITTQWLNDDDLSPDIDIPSLAFAEEIPIIPDDHSDEIDPKSLLSDRNKSERGEGDSGAVADSNGPNAKLSLLLNLSSTMNGTSEESDTEDLEKFYPEVLDFETKKVFAERGTVRTIVRTMMRAAESRLSSSHNVSKFTESTIDMCTRSSKSRCSNGQPYVEGDHMRPSEGESSHLGPAGMPSLLLYDSITASKDVDSNSTKSKNINSSIIDKLEGSAAGVIQYGFSGETDAGDGHFECEAEKNPIENDYTRFLSSCKSPSSLTYRKPSPSSIADIPSEKKKKDIPMLKRLSEFDGANELNGESNYQHQLKALKLNRPPSKDSHNVRNSIDDDDSIKRSFLHPHTSSSSSSKYSSRVSSPSDKLNMSSAVCLNDIGGMDDGVMHPSPYQIYLVNRLNALSPRPPSPPSPPSPSLHHPSHQSSFIILPALPLNCASQRCQAEHLPVSTSPPSVTALLPSPERIQVNSPSESSYPTDSTVPRTESKPITPLLSSSSHLIAHSEQERTAFTPTRLLLFTLFLVEWTFYLLQRNTYVNKVNPISLSPWIGQHNASMVINQRLSVMQEEYQSLLLRKDWHYLSTTFGTTAESLTIMGSAKHEADKHFIKVTAEFDFPPFAVAEALQWDDGQLRYTLEEIDGYHGSLELLHTITNNMHLFKKTTKDLNFLSKRAMTSAITETTTQREFSVYSAPSEPSFLSRMITSMLIPFLSSPIIPTSIPTPTPTSASTPTVSQESASASTVPPSPPSLPPAHPLLPPPPLLPLPHLPPLLPLLPPPPLQPSSTADTYTIPIGTITRAVVNINIDLESLPFIDPPLYSIFSLSQCHKVFESMTGISISDSADYLVESFYYYYYYYSYNSYDIADKADIHYGKKGAEKRVEKGVGSGSVLVDSLYHEIKNVLAILEQQEAEKTVSSYYDEITWFIELAGGRTRLISILHADLGPGIPHWIAERGLASNAVQSIILLKNVQERDFTLQQDIMNLELSNDQDL